MNPTYDALRFCSGDIGLSADNSLFGKTLRFFQSLWTKKAKANHAFAFVTESFIIEALVKITLSLKEKYKNRTIWIYQLPLTSKERYDFSKGLASRENDAYGWDKYPLFFADCITTWFKRTILRQDKPCFWFTKTFHVTNIPVCSQLVVWALYEFTSYRLKDVDGNEVSWMVISPDYLQDLLQLPVNRAKLVYTQNEQ